MQAMGKRALLVASALLGLAAPCASAQGPAPPIGSSSTDAVRQEDGKIVTIANQSACAGLELGCTSGFAVSRREADGAPDASFGAGGTAVTGFGNGVEVPPASVAIDPQGRIVVVGIVEVSSAPQRTGIALARYLPSGALDPSFGSGGTAIASVPGASLAARGLVLGNDGAIFVSTPYRTDSEASVAVARFTADGRLDAGFGAGGIARAIGGATSPEDVGPIALQPDGKILVGATGRTAAFSRQLAVIRFDPNGALDAGFGAGGVFSTSRDQGEWGSLALQAVFADAAGHVLLAATERVGEHSPFDTVAIRLDSAGALDPGFGESRDGSVELPSTSLLSAAPLADGGIFLAAAPGRGLLVARLGGDGRPVPTFNAGGKGVVTVAGLTTSPTAAFAEPDGGALALALVQAAHCRNQGRSGWHRCSSEATIAYGPNGFLRRGFGGVGFLTRPPIHYCRQLPTTACGVDLDKRQLAGLVGRGSPRKAHLRGDRVLFRVRCDRRIETRCRIATGVRLGPGPLFTSETVSVRAGRSRQLRLPAPAGLGTRLAAAGSELRLRLRQRVAANGLHSAFAAGIRLLRR
jgi:uncharacterized delta-60 repeat protein